jgi:hypothetical protein
MPSSVTKSVNTTTSEYVGLESFYGGVPMYSQGLWACNQESHRDLIYTKSATFLHTVSFDPPPTAISDVNSTEYYIDGSFSVNSANLNKGDADDAVSAELVDSLRQWVSNAFRYPTVVRDRVTALVVLYPVYDSDDGFQWNTTPNLWDLKNGSETTPTGGHGNWAKARKIGFLT